MKDERLVITEELINLLEKLEKEHGLEREYSAYIIFNVCGAGLLEERGLLDFKRLVKNIEDNTLKKGVLS